MFNYHRKGTSLLQKTLFCKKGFVAFDINWCKGLESFFAKKESFLFSEKVRQELLSKIKQNLILKNVCKKLCNYNLNMSKRKQSNLKTVF